MITAGAVDPWNCIVNVPPLAKCDTLCDPQACAWIRDECYDNECDNKCVANMYWEDNLVNLMHGMVSLSMMCYTVSLEVKAAGADMSSRRLQVCAASSSKDLFLRSVSDKILAGRPT